MKRLEKESFVSSFKEELQTASTVVAVNRSTGITVGEITELRSEMRKNNANLKVVKNTLALIAVKGSPLELLSDYLKGPTALAYSDEPVGMAKVLVKFASENEKLTIMGGIMDGNPISAGNFAKLASLPSFDELRAKIIGLLTASAAKIARTVKEPGAQIARVVSLRAQALEGQ
ncbi:MAG: 50S ribosomal protein L10 [Holosporales bacterium]|jgi:large subunit ribosomal protein L10|nr:50S ribosomal protein L10 [Holosporales bacterium]